MFSAQFYSYRATLVLLLTSCITGCAAKPKTPLAPPDAQVSLSHFAGTPLSGPLANEVAATDPAAALSVDVRVVALPSNQISDLGPMAPHVRLISASGGGSAVLRPAELTRAGRFASGQAASSAIAWLESQPAGTLWELASYRVAIPAGVTATVRAADRRSGESAPRSVEVLLHHPASFDLELAAAVRDVPPEPRKSGGDDDPASPQPAARAPEAIRELAVLQSATIEQPTNIAVLIPFEFAGHPGKSVLVLLRADRGQAGAEMEEALARCATDVKQSAQLARAQPAAPTAGIAEWPGFQAALNGLAQTGSRRTSLAYLTSQTGATICEDVTLVAGDEVLADLSAAISQRIASALDRPLQREAIGWTLDAAALEQVSKLQSANKLPPELLAALLRHTGQVGAYPGSVEQIVQGVATRKDFDSRVAAENLVYLEDNSPAARVRAFDWLSARRGAPAGYDPLAPPKQRQEALQKAWDAMAAQAAAQQGGKP